MHRRSAWIAALSIMSTMIPGAWGAAGFPATAEARRAPARPPAYLTVELCVFRLLNADRAAAGIPPLVLSPRLSTVARAHSKEMAQHHYFAHLSLHGQSPLQRISAAGISYQTAGENLGWATGYAGLQAATLLNSAMMAEPPDQENHRYIILDPVLDRVGIGVSVAADGRLYLTEDFTN